MNSHTVLQWIGSCKNILKMPYSGCLFSRNVAIETVSNFACVSSNSSMFNKAVTGMYLVVWNR